MAVAASTVPVEVYARDGDIIALPMTSGTTIYKGDIVRILAAGTATSTAAPTAADMFAGVAMETVTDVGGAMNIRVWTTGVFSFALTDFTGQTDVGTIAYFDEAAATGNQRTVINVAGLEEGRRLIIGAIVGIDPDKPTSNVLVKILPGITLAVVTA